MSAREPDWKGWAGLGLSVAAALVAVVLYVLTGLGGKASAAEVQELRTRQTRTEVYLGWTMGAVYELTKHAGVVVPPPPSTVP